jgi:hypothetical protein
MNDSKRMEITEHMKLYTEEQMHSVILLALGRHGIYIPNKHYQDLIDLLTSVPLPSDEEIISENQLSEFNSEDVAYYNGAKWMRDKIIGGKK